MKEIGDIEEQLSDFEKIREQYPNDAEKCLQRIKVRDTIISMREKYLILLPTDCAKNTKIPQQSNHSTFSFLTIVPIPCLLLNFISRYSIMSIIYLLTIYF